MSADWKDKASEAEERLRRGPFASALKGVQELLAHMKAMDEQGPSCEEVDDLLPEVVMREGAGEDVDLLFPQVMRHIERCDDCMAAYVDLSSDLEEDFLPEDVVAPEFDLSFLRERPDPWQILLEVQAKVVEKGVLLLEFIRGAIQPPRERAAVLGEDLLTGIPLRAGFERPKGEVGEQWEESDHLLLAGLVFPEVEGIEIVVEAERLVGADRCTVWVRVDSPEWDDLAGRLIRLVTATGKQERHTDARGYAAFHEVDVAELEGMQLELPTD